MRLAVDTGGTFTDLVVESNDCSFRLFKTPSVPTDSVAGVLTVIELAAREWGQDVPDFLRRVDLFIHGTTRGLNAILTGEVARTAFVTTQGHPDILLFREGGRREPFNHVRQYPPPYVPRNLTYELTERVASDGSVLIEFDENNARLVVEKLAFDQVDAVAVCLLWSIVNPVHERRFAELLDAQLPGVPYTLSHQLNPAMREYRRASSSCIDASLKPLISRYLAELIQCLADSGFMGRPLMVTSGGGVLDFDDVIRAPIHSLGSGPAMAPVAGRHYAREETGRQSAIVVDAGGTSFDVSIVRRGRIPWTRETWIGEEFTGHITGFPSIDVKSIGAGGGSIAWVDSGGLLHVGPGSAGADPGPACYGRGATQPTVTDASLVLGYLSPTNFLGGRILLDAVAAERAIEEHISRPLGLDVPRGASAILEVMTEHMVQAIEEIAIRQGVATADAVLVAGGGSCGFNCVSIARRVGCPVVLVPEIAAGLSAAGGLLSDLMSETRITYPVSTTAFDFAGVNGVLAELAARCDEFLQGPGAEALYSSIEFYGEARYPDQVWELEVPLSDSVLSSVESLEALRVAFHHVHRETFAVADDASAVEIITWGARVCCRLQRGLAPVTDVTGEHDRHVVAPVDSRRVYFEGCWVECDVHTFDSLVPNMRLTGPSLIESPSTTVVLPDRASLVRTRTGSLRISPAPEGLIP